MKNILFILSLFICVSCGAQKKIWELPNTNTGTVNDLIVKESATHSSSSTQNMTLAQFANLLDSLGLITGGGGGSTDTSHLSSRINLKVDSAKVSNDSLYLYHNGTRVFVAKVLTATDLTTYLKTDGTTTGGTSQEQSFTNGVRVQTITTPSNDIEVTASHSTTFTTPQLLISYFGGSGKKLIAADNSGKLYETTIYGDSAYYTKYEVDTAKANLRTSFGSFLPLAGGTMDGGSHIYFGSGGQNISQGTFDNGTGGNNGVSLNCAIGYELNWQGGHLTSSYNAGANFTPLLIDSGLNVTGGVQLRNGLDMSSTDIINMGNLYNGADLAYDLGQQSSQWSHVWAGDGLFSNSLGIGTTTPSEKLEVNGKVRIDTIPDGASTDSLLVHGSDNVVKKISASDSRGYKVYSVALSEEAPASLTSGTLTIGQHYTITIYVAGDDFSNVANVISGTINTTGCVFIAIGTTPTLWLTSQLDQDGSPFVTAEYQNDFGATTFTWSYNSVGNYTVTASSNVFKAFKCPNVGGTLGQGNGDFYSVEASIAEFQLDENFRNMFTGLSDGTGLDGYMQNNLIELRVYNP